VLIRLRDIRAVAFDPPGPAVPSAPAADPGPPALSGARMAADGEFRKLFRDDAQPVIELVIGHPDPGAVVTEYEKRNWYVFDAKRHPRLYRYTYRLQLRVRGSGGTEKEGRVFVKYSGDENGTPITASHPYFESTRDDLSRELAHSRLAHQAGVFPPVVRVGDALVTLESGYEDINTRFRELRGSMPMEQRNAKFIELAQETGKALGTLHSIRRPAKDGSGVEGYLVHLDLNWIGDGPSPLKDHIRVRPDGSIEFIDLGMSEFRDDKTRLFEFRLIGGIVTGEMPAPIRAEALAAYEAAYERAMSGARMAGLPDEALTADTPVREFAKATGLWERGRVVRTFAEPESGFEVHEVEAEIDFESEMPEGTGILRELFDFKWQGLGVRRMRFYVLFDERRMPAAIYPKEGQVPPSIWQEDLAKAPAYHRRYYERIDLSPYTLPTHVLRDAGAGLSRTALRAEFDRVSRLRERVKKFDEHYGTLDQAIPGRPVSESILANTGVGGAVPYVYLEWDTRHHRLWALSFNEKALEDPDSGLRAFHRAQYTPDEEIDKNRFFERLFGSPERPRAVWVQYPWVYPFQRNIGVDKAFRREVYETLRLEAATRLKDGDAVADVGTGTGVSLWVAWLAGLSSGLHLRYFASDLNPMAAANARFNFRLNGMTVDTSVADVMNGRDGRTAFAVPVQFLLANAPASSGPAERADDGREDRGILQNTSTLAHYDGGDPARRFWDRLIDQIGDPRFMDARRGTVVIWNKAHSSLFDRIRSMRAAASAERIPADGTRDDALGYATYQVRLGPKLGRLGERLEIARADLGAAYGLMLRAVQNLPERERGLYLRLAFPFYLTLPTIGVAKYLPMAALAASGHWWATLAAYYAGPIVRLTLMLYYRFRHRLPMGRAITFSLVPQAGTFLALPAQVLDRESLSRAKTVGRLASDLRKAAAHSVAPSRVRRTVLAFSLRLADAVADRMEEDGDVRQWTVLGPGASRRKVDRELARGRKVLLVGYRGSPLAHDFDDGIPSSGSSGGADGVGIHHLDLGLAASALVSDEAPQAAHWIKPISSHPDGARMALSARPGELVKRAAPVRDGVEVSVFEVDGLPAAVNLGVPGEGLSVTVAPLLKTETVAAYLERGGMSRMRAFDAAPGRRTTLWIETQDRMRSEVERLSAKSPADSEAPVLESGVLGTEIARGWTQFLKQVGADADAKSVYIVTPYGELPPFEDAGGEWTGRAGAARMADPSGDGFIWIHTTGLKKWFKQHVRAYLKFMKELPDPAAHGSDTWTDPGSGLVFRRDRDSRNRTYWKLPVDQLEKLRERTGFDLRVAAEDEGERALREVWTASRNKLHAFFTGGPDAPVPADRFELPLHSTNRITLYTAEGRNAVVITIPPVPVPYHGRAETEDGAKYYALYETKSGKLIARYKYVDQGFIRVELGAGYRDHGNTGRVRASLRPEADHPSAIIESSKLKPAGLERFERLRTELTARLTAVPVPGEDPLPAEFRSAGEDKVHALAEALASNMVRAQSSPGVPEEWTRFGLIDTADPDALADAGHAITTFRRAWDSLPAPVRARSGIAERVIDGMPVSQMLLIREGYARLARSIGAGDGDIAPELSAALVTRALSVRSTSFFGNLDTLTARFDLNVQDSDTDAGDAAGKSLLTDSYITGLGEVARAAGYKMKRFLEATDRLEAEGIGWGSPSDPMSRHMLLTLLVSISSEVMDDARQGLDTARLDRALRATEAALGPAAGSADAPARQEWILRMYVEALNSSAPYARRTFGLGNAPRPAAAAGSRPRAAAGTSRKPAASRPEAIKPASQKPSLYSTWAFSHAGIKYSLGKPLLKMLRVDPDRVPADGVSDQLEVVIERKEGQDPRISIKSAAHPSTQIIVLRADDEKPVVSDRILTPGSSRRELSVWDVLQNQKEVPGLFVTDLAPSLSAPKPPPARDLSKARATKQDRPAAVKVIKPASPAPTRTPAFRAVTAPLPKPVPEPAEEIDLDALERTVNARRTHEDVPVVHLFIGKGVRASAPRARIEAIVRATSEGLKQIGLARRIWTLPADDPSIDAHYVVEIDPQRVGKYTITADDLMSVLSFNGDASRAFLLTKDGWRRSSLMSPGIGQLKGLVIAASGARMASRKGGKADDRSGRALRELRRAKEAVRHAERAAERARDGVDLPAVLDDRQVEELKRIRDKYAYDKPGSVQLNLSRRAAVLAERAEPTPALSGEAFQALVARSAERAELARMSEDPEGRMRAVLGKKYAERLKRLLGAHHASDRVIAWDEAGEEVKEYRSEGEFKEARRVVTRHTAVVQPFGAAPRRVTYYLKRWDAPGAGHWMLRWMADASFKRQEAMARIIRGAALGPETAFIGRGLAVIEDGGRPLSEIVADREASMGDRVRVAASVGEALGLLHSNRRSDLRGRVRYLTHGDLVSIDDSSGDPADILNDHIRLEPGSFRATFIDPGLASFEDDAGRSSEKDRLQQTLSRWADDAPGSMVLYDAFESAYRAAFQSGPSVGPPAGPDASGRGAFSSFIKRWIGYIGWGGIAAFTAAALLRFDAALYWDYIWTTAVYGWTLTLAVMSVSLLNPGRIALALSAALIAGTMIALRVEALEPRVAQSLTASTIAVMAAILVSKLLYTDAAPGPDNGGPDADRERLRRAAVSAVWWSAAATPLARLYIGLFWNPFIQRSGMHDAWDKTIFDLGFASTFVHVPLALLINLVYGELKSVGTDLLGGGWRSVLRSGPVRSLNRFYPVNSVFWMAALPMVYGWSGDDRARLLIASSVATAIFVFLVEKPLRSWYAGARMSGREELLERDRRIGAELDLAVERIMNLDVIRSARSSGDWPVRRRVAEALERSGADLKNGYRYLDHGLRYVVFQNDAYPGLVFKKLKHGTPKRIYYEAWLNWLLIIKADPAFQPLPVSAAGDAQGWPLLRLPSVAGYAFSAGAGPEFVVQEHVQGRKAMASDSRTAVDAAAKGLEKLGVVWRDSAAGNFKVTADGGVVIVDTGDQSFQLQEAALGRLVEAAALPADYLPPTDEAIDSALRAVMGPGEYQMLFTGPNRSAREPVSEDRKKILNGLRATAVFYHAIVSGLPAEAAADETLKYIKWLNRPADPAPMPPSVRAVVIHPGAIDHKRITSLWNGYDGSVEVMNLDPGTAREARAAAVERPTGFVVLHLRSDRLDEHGEISATIPAHVREFVTGAQSRKGPAVPVIINIPHRAAEGVLQELERWKETGLIRDHVMLGSGQGIAEHLDLAWLAAAYPDRVWTRLIRPIPGGWELRSRASGAALKASYGRTDTGWGSWSRPRFNLTIEITPPAEPAAKFVFKAAREEDIELVPSENGDHQIIIRRLAENAPLAPAAAALAAFRIRIEPASGARMADAAERIDRAVAARKDEWYGRRITNGVIGRWVGLSKDRVRDMRVEKRLAPATERVIADHEKFAMSWASPHRILAAAEQVAAAGGPLTWDAVAAAMRDHPQWSKNPDRPRSLKKLAANLPHYLQQNPWLKTRIQALKDGSAAVRPGRPMNRERHDLDALKARVEALLPGLDKRGRTVRGTADRPIFEALASLIGEAKAVPVGRSLPRLTDSEVARRSGFSRQTLYVRLGDSMSGAPLERTFNAFLADYDAIRMRREAHLLEGFLDRLVRTGSQVNPSLEYLTLEAPVSAASVRALIKPGSALSEKGRKNYERLKNRHRSRLDRAIVRAAADLIRANGPRTRITHLALAERMRENGFTGSRKEATLDSLRQSVTLRFRNDPGLTRSVRELRSAARMSGGGVLEPAADHRRLELSGVTSGPELSRRYAEYVSHLVSVRGLAPIEALSQAGSEAGDALLAGRVGRMTFLRGLQWFGPIGSYLPRFETSAVEFMKVFNGGHARVSAPAHEWLIGSIAPELLSRKKAGAGRPYVLVIAGRSGSGKSTLAQDVKKGAEGLGIASAVVSMDDFLLDRKTRILRGLRGRDSFDQEAVTRVFGRMAAGEAADLPRTEAVGRNISSFEAVDFGSIDLVIVEGAEPLEFESVAGIADRRILLYESGETQYLSRHWRDQEERGFGPFEIAYSWITRGLREQGSVLGSSIERYDQLIYKSRQPAAMGVSGRPWRLLRKKVPSAPREPAAAARMSDRPRPIDELTWDDADEVTAHFKALLALFNIGTPRAVIRDGAAVSSFSTPSPITAQALSELSAYGSTPARLYSTLRSHLIIAAELEAPGQADWFHERFGTNRSGAVWFEYHDGVRERIYRYVEERAAAGQRGFRILVQGTANGEDAAAMAVLLDHRFPDLKFDVIGKDVLRPKPGDLNWFSESRVPAELKDGADKYFDVKGEVQDENKKPVRILGLKRAWADRLILEQGDIIRPDPKARDMDIVVSTRLLFHAVTREEDLRSAIRNVRASLKAGGLFVLQAADSRSGAETSFMKREFGANFDAEGKGVYRAMASGSRMSVRPIPVLDRLHQARTRARERVDAAPGRAWILILPEIILGALFGALFIGWGVPAFFAAAGLLVLSLAWHELGHRAAMLFLEWRAYRSGRGPFGVIRIDWPRLQVSIANSHEFSMDLITLKTVALAGPVATWMLAVGFWVLEFVRLAGGPELLPRYMGLWAAFMNIFFWFHHMSPRSGSGGDHPLAFWAAGVTRLIRDAGVRYGIDLLPAISGGFVLSSDLKQVYYIRQLNSGPARVPGTLPLRFTIEGYPAPGKFFRIPVRGKLIRTLEGKAIVRTRQARYALYKVEGIPPSALNRYRTVRGRSAARMSVVRPEEFDDFRNAEWILFDPRSFGRKDPERLRVEQKVRKVRFDRRSTRLQSKARELIKEIGLPETGAVAVLGPQDRNLADRRFHRHVHWEEVLAGTDKPIHIYEPEAVSRIAWKEWAGRPGRTGKWIIHQAGAERGDNAHFQYDKTSVGPDLAAVVAVSVFSSPFLYKGERGALARALAGRLQPGALLIIGWYSDRHDHPEIKQEVERTRSSLMAIQRHLSRRGLSLRLEALMREPQSPKMHDLVVYKVNGIGGPERGPQTRKVRAATSAARMAKKAERVKWTSLEDKIAGIGRDWNRDALQKVEMSRRALEALLGRELMPSRMRRLEAGEAAVRALIEAARQALLQADGWTSISREELAALTAIRVPGFDRKRLDRLIHQMNAAQFPEFGRMVDEVTRYSPRTAEIPHKLLEYRQSFRGSRPDLADFDPFVRAAEVSGQKTAVKYQMTRDPYLNRAWKLTASAMRGDAARERKAAVKPEAMTGSSEGARLAVLPPRAARADELAAAPYEVPNGTFFEDPMNLRRLPGRFAMTVRVPGPTPGSLDPVAVIAAPAAGRAAMPASGPRLVFFADRGLPLPSAHLRLREPLIDVRSSASVLASPKDAAIAGHLDHAQVFSRIHETLWGAPRYAVHDVARYWDREVLGAPDQADEHYKLLLNDLREAVLGHKNWKVRFTYRGLPLDERTPDHFNRHDRRLFHLARKALLRAGAHASGPFPQNAHVIGDVDVDTANEAADDPEILTMNGWSGAVISRSTGLRPSVPTLLLQLSLSSNAPIRSDDPVLDLLRMLTGRGFSIEEADALRRGEFGVIRSLGDLTMFAIQNMGARLTRRLEEAAKTAFAAGSSA
jgi:uridine kinase